MCENMNKLKKTTSTKAAQVTTPTDLVLTLKSYSSDRLVRGRTTKAEGSKRVLTSEKCVKIRSTSLDRHPQMCY